MQKESYRICVASHLSPDWRAISGLAELTTGHDAAGRPTSRLLVELNDRADLIHVLTELHAANVAILTLELVRSATHQYA